MLAQAAQTPAKEGKMPTVQLSYRWRDNEGVPFSETLDFDAGDITTLAIAQAQATKYELLMEAMSGCAVEEIYVRFPLVTDGSENTDSGYSVHRGAYLAFRDADGRPEGVYIPGILEDKVSTVGKMQIVDEDDTQVAAFIAAATGDGADGEEPLSTSGSAAQWVTYRGGKGTNRK